MSIVLFDCLSRTGQDHEKICMHNFIQRNNMAMYENLSFKIEHVEFPRHFAILVKGSYYIMRMLTIHQLLTAESSEG